MTSLYDHIADGLRRNVPEALFAHLDERVWVAEGLANPEELGPTHRAELPEMARQLNDMCH
jgi:hypothetical protein